MRQQLTRKRDGAASNFAYQWHTYWDGMADGSEQVTLPPDGFFYDELPLRVRTIDFSKPNGDFEIQLAPTIISSKKNDLVWKPAQVQLRIRPRGDHTSPCDMLAGSDDSSSIAISPISCANGTAADGNHLTLKRSLKVDYWNYHKPGTASARLARLRMLEHPD